MRQLPSGRHYALSDRQRQRRHQRDATREYLSVVEDQLRGENVREVEVTV